MENNVGKPFNFLGKLVETEIREKQIIIAGKTNVVIEWRIMLGMKMKVYNTRERERERERERVGETELQLHMHIGNK